MDYFKMMNLEKTIHNRQEAQAPTTYKTPLLPTQRETDEHNITHLPYRDWCKHCVNLCTRKEQITTSSTRRINEAKRYTDRLRLPQMRQRQALRNGAYYVRVNYRTWLRNGSILQRSQYRGSESDST
eukprot:5335247-Amphidinium_carterae.1